MDKKSPPYYLHFLSVFPHCEEFFSGRDFRFMRAIAM